jgi:O-antigen ligase
MIKALSKSGYLAYIFSFIAVLLLPVHNDFLPPFMIAWMVFWFLEFLSRNAKITEDEKRTRSLLFLFLALNVIFLIGLLFSEDRHNGSVLFSRRFSLLLFPIILFSPGADIKKRINLLLKVFVGGIVTYMLFCYAYALFRSVSLKGGGWSFDPSYPAEPWLNYFFGQLLSVGQHPSYIAMYALLGMFIALEFSTYKSMKRSVRLLWLIAALFLFASLYFLSSRASYLAVLLILPVFLWIKFKPRRLSLKAIVSVIIFCVLIISIFLFNKRVSIYFDKSVDPAILNDGRMEIWKSALKVAEKKPLFGVGIGDYYNAMDKEFKQSGYTTGYYKDFNAHNQYLEILCISGIVGFLFFIGIIGLMLTIAIKDKNLLYGVFLMMIMIFFLFESILSRFAGNSFFALFSFLLIYYKGIESQERNKMPQDQAKEMKIL